MAEIIDLRSAPPETNTELWSIAEVEGEQVLQVTGHVMESQKSGTAAYLDEDHIGRSVVALFGGARRNYRMSAEMRFLGHHHHMPNAGWFGFAIRAQDFQNYEIVWFMPGSEREASVAYVPVAHGIVPWWTEAYNTQKKGNPPVPANDWFQARMDVTGDEFSVYVNGKAVFTKKITYYLVEGRPGLFVGTATDAAFRRVVIEDLP